MGPAKLPPAIVAKLSADVEKIFADAAVQSNLSNASVEPYKGSAQDLAKLIKADSVRYLQLAKAADTKAE